MQEKKHTNINKLDLTTTSITVKTSGDQKKLNPQIPSIFYAISEALSPYLEPQREGNLIIEITWRPSNQEEIDEVFSKYYDRA